MCYPLKWCYSKLVVLFKSGDKMSCDNYRGISIMDTLAKIYDTLILNRLLLWFNIDKCQAGAQKGRGCIEQILTLRMLCDYFLYKKLKLYVLFIDYSKAYDRVPRHKLIEVLKSRGCGKVMLKAIQAMYTCTKNVLKTAVISAAIGVRQGAPSSCLLFIIYINEMVKMLKNAIAADGVLGLLHALLLMDDTVILATSRERCEAKLRVVIQYCQEFGMIINTKKTQFFVINGNKDDMIPLEIDRTKVCYTHQYLYLGAWFTDSGKITDSIALHEKSNQATINKFAIFCAANRTMPFSYKKLVFDAAVTSSLLYSAESWLTNNIKSIEKHYNQLVRCLLGVRKNTSIELCLVESGIPPIQYVLAKRRQKFFASNLNSNDIEQPLIYAYHLCREYNTPTYRFISRCLVENIEQNPFHNTINIIKDKSTDGTKMRTYINELNVPLNLHPIYTTNVFIPDYLRESFSRIRLMSHNLKIEKGRWSRTSRERRVCQCNNSHVQTEAHVLIHCPLTYNIRLRYPMLDFINITCLLGEVTHIYQLCNYIHEVLKVYK